MTMREKATGSDLSRDWRAFEDRVAVLPEDYRHAWGEIKGRMLRYADFSGRNLTPILDGVLELLETTAADGQSAAEALGDDLAGFCAAVAGADGTGDDRHRPGDYRQRWRDQLNRTVARRLTRAGY